MRPDLSRPRIFVTQPVAKSAIDRLRKVASVTVNPDSSRIIGKKPLIAAVRRCDILFSLLHDKIDRDVIAALASGQRGHSIVHAHSASEDARERAKDTRPEPG